MGLVGIEGGFGHKFANAFNALVDAGDVDLGHDEGVALVLETSEFEDADDLSKIEQHAYFLVGLLQGFVLLVD